MIWKVSKERQQKRIGLCSDCPNFRAKTRTCGKPVVGEWVVHEGEKKRLCGCFMDYKTKLKFGSCPLDIWGSSKQEMEELMDNKEFLKDILSLERVSAKDLQKAYFLYSDILGTRKTPTSCPPCIISDLKKVIKKIEVTLSEN